jgi:hypothetical protein
VPHTPGARGSFGGVRIHYPDITAFAERCVAKDETGHPYCESAALAASPGEYCLNSAAHDTTNTQ